MGLTIGCSHNRDHRQSGQSGNCAIGQALKTNVLLLLHLFCICPLVFSTIDSIQIYHKAQTHSSETGIFPIKLSRLQHTHSQPSLNKMWLYHWSIKTSNFFLKLLNGSTIVFFTETGSPKPVLHFTVVGGGVNSQ